MPTRYSLFIYQVERESAVNQDMFWNVVDRLDECLTTVPEETHLDVWLDSPGGTGDHAYKTILELRSRAKTLHCCVADYAKSAATLMALGMDLIYMGPSAELGPLDVQVTHPDREDREVSGLDVVNSFAQLTTVANGLVLMNGMRFLKTTGLTRSEVMREQLKFMSDLLNPIVAKIDPHLLHQAHNQLQVAKEYAKRLIRQRNVAPEYALTSSQIGFLCKTLIEEYKAHGFVISRDEARALRLPVVDAEHHEHWQFARTLLRQAVANETDITEVYTDEEIKDEIDRAMEEAENESAVSAEADVPAPESGRAVVEPVAG